MRFPVAALPAPNHIRLTRNNLDLLRLMFAGIVVIVHAYELSGYQELRGIASMLSSLMAVRGFFVISGFLVVMACERAGSPAAYCAKRARRIYPAYFVVVMRTSPSSTSSSRPFPACSRETDSTT